MMSYTMPCTSLCSSEGTLMRRTSPCTRIIGGKPDERCRSDALFFTENASSSAMSIDVLSLEGVWPRLGARFGGLECALKIPPDYVHNRRQPASRAATHFRSVTRGYAHGDTCSR